VNFQERKRLILSFLEDVPSMNVHELSEKLGVSEITVRRDLNAMASKSLVTRTHGGVMHNKHAEDPTYFSTKAISNPEKKREIAEKASAMVHDGDIVFMDCGSTVFCMADFIRKKRVTVITNSLPLASALLNSNVKINLVGGELDPVRQAVHGLIAEEHIKRYRARKAFIGVDGITADGLYSHSETEASTTICYARQAREVFLLCDSTKINKPAYFHCAPITVIDQVITESSADEETLKELRNAGLAIIK